MTQKDVELKLCKESFLFFVGFVFWHIYKVNFIFYAFHKELAEILLRLPEEKRVIINAPPRIGKTELVKMYIAWRFLLDPTSSVINC